ncbi:LOW QUALITY PROTEIN: hypothetical protein CISG_07841 [Coccidioides immitis RMSCC 3703]|uniref:RRM domain-containing protein n=1 Tax=Coccidioides immitis RMSCC 3703 TaxID=454286 RepID=A0A0J8R4P9_COCIT|nr:LOW QUALITY PROTEIN: hypothetical protein CISG_07841 [Coccidioides immitis RMSCC 3703]
MSTSPVKRLHITPLDAALLNTILHPTTRSLATDISFHTVQTFPESNYGFVTLPTAEAEKLVKKLNGSILKGRKLRIQEARLRREIPLEELIASPKDPGPKVTCNTAMAKNAKLVMTPSKVMNCQRRVKRGWTEAPDKENRSRKADKKEQKKDSKGKKAQKSKYTNNPECLFQTLPPPNKADLSKADKKRKRKPSDTAAVVVHEFEKLTTHPSFLRTGQDSSSKSLTNEYVDGKGWLDRSGSVKEASSLKTKPEPTSRIRPQKRNVSKISVQITENWAPSSSEDETSSCGSSSEEESSGYSSSSSSDEALNKETTNDCVVPPSRSTSKRSSNDKSLAGNGDIPSSTTLAMDEASSDSTSELSDEGGVDQGNEKIRDRHDSIDGVDDETSSSNSSSEDGTAVSSSALDGGDSHSDEEEEIENEPPTKEVQQADTTPECVHAPKEIHPLEALFKRPASAAATPPGKAQPAASTAFSFFGNAEENSDIEDEDDYTTSLHGADGNIVAEPQTPFTKMDLQIRAVRSVPLLLTRCRQQSSMRQQKKIRGECRESVQMATQRGDRGV